MLPVSLWLVACNPPLPEDAGPLSVDSAGDTDTGDTGLAGPDADGDGWETEDGDCDDAQATVYPDAQELLDGLDNDCSGFADESIRVDSESRSIGSDSAWFGYTMVTAQDFTDDAIPDLAVGAPASNGAVFLFDATEFSEGGAAVRAHLISRSSTENTGYDASVLVASLDGSGPPELVVGAPLVEGDGAVYLIAGTDVKTGGAEFEPRMGRTIDGPTKDVSDAVDEAFGTSLAFLNERLYVGAPGEDTGLGAFYVFPAALVPLGDIGSVDDDAHVAADVGERGTGTDMIGMDWNGDGAEDLVVSTPLSTSTQAVFGGGALIWAGGSDLDGLDDGARTDSASVRIQGDAVRAYLGGTVRALGDADGDGHDELVLASFVASDLATQEIAVMEGNATPGEISTATAVARILGIQPAAYTSHPILCADVTSDGFADLVVGQAGTEPGQVFVFEGKRLLSLAGGTLETSDADATIEGIASGDGFGMGLAGLDVTQSDAMDLFIGAPLSGVGAFYLVPSYY